MSAKSQFSWDQGIVLEGSFLWSVEVYQSDFNAEREARARLVGEKDQLAEDLRHLQRRNQQLIDDLSKYQQTPNRQPPTSTTAKHQNTDFDPHRGSTSPSINPTEAPEENGPERYTTHCRIHELGRVQPQIDGLSTPRQDSKDSSLILPTSYLASRDGVAALDHHPRHHPGHSIQTQPHRRWPAWHPTVSPAGFNNFDNQRK
uniref:NF-kappa-B essential modulator NEMO CC2-LZ domain-containing protein n=1 Tax=Timema cristinae TaxID=61476 RepID=A0A7R9DC29_TIMCR|nr:unnamed protein product [Timema cristinae]